MLLKQRSEMPPSETVDTFGNCTVKVHGKPSLERVRKATEAFMRNVSTMESKKKGSNNDERNA